MHESEVTQSCLTLSNPWTSLPGSSIHGIFQARALEWVPLPSPMHESEVTQSCPTLSDPWASPPGSSTHGILQARALEWVAIALISALISD